MEKKTHQVMEHHGTEQSEGMWISAVPATIDALARLAKTLDEHPKGAWGVVPLL
jgi:hypothetical protein